MVKPNGDFITVGSANTTTLKGATFASNSTDFVHGADVHGSMVWPEETTAFLFPFIARTGSRAVGGRLFTNKVTIESGAYFDMKRILLNNDDPSVSINLSNGTCGEFGFYTTGDLTLTSAATSSSPLEIYGQSGGDVNLTGEWYGKLVGDIDLTAGSGSFSKDDTVILDMNGYQILTNSEPLPTPSFDSMLPITFGVVTVISEIPAATQYRRRIRLAQTGEWKYTNWGGRYVYATGLEPNTAYEISAQARNDTLESDWSTPVPFTTLTAFVAPEFSSVIPISESKVRLSWSESTEANYYTLQRSTDQENWTNIYPGGTSYEDSGLAANTLYYYRVKVSVGSGDLTQESYWSEIASVKTLLPAPEDVSASSLTLAITITWSSVLEATSYTVERSVDQASWIEVGTPITTTFTDSGLTSGITYYYRITAKSSANTSAPSSVVSATANPEPVTPPDPPSGLSATAVAYNRIDVTWSISTGATNYILDRMASGGSWTTVYTGPNTRYVNTGLIAETVYSFRVRAGGAGGTSGYSSTATATTPEKPEPTPGNYDVITPYVPAMENMFGSMETMIVAAVAMGQPAIVKRKES